MASKTYEQVDSESSDKVAVEGRFTSNKMSQSNGCENFSFKVCVYSQNSISDEGGQDRTKHSSAVVQMNSSSNGHH